MLSAGLVAIRLWHGGVCQPTRDEPRLHRFYMDNWWIEGIDDPLIIEIAAFPITIIPLASVSTILALEVSI